MSIPLIQEATKDAINTSIIAIKRNIERINMLLGLVDSDSPDLSGLATKQELEDAITQVETDLAPVDEVTSGNMQSVTSNAVAESSVLKADFDNLVFLGQQSTTGQFTLNGNLSNYSLVLIGVSLLSANRRTSVQLIPKIILKNRNASNNSMVASIFLTGDAFISFNFHYVDDTHLYINQVNYSTAWQANGYLGIWGIK